MIKKIKIILDNKNKVLLMNFLSLTLLQGVNYILPLLTFPYLFKTLGADYFGLLAFATAFISYFQIVVDYGFNLSATREVSINRDDPKKIGEIYSSVLIIKTILLIVSLIVISIVVLFFQRFSENYHVYFYTFGMVLGQAFFSTWFFQGMEDMKYVTLLNIIGKVGFTLAIFLFVKIPSDYLLVPIFTSGGYILIAIWSMFLIRFRYGVRISTQPISTLLGYLKSSWHLFVSNISVTLYTFTTVILLGFFTNNVIVGYYTVAERIIAALRSIIGPISQTFYPYLNRIAIGERESVFNFNRKFLLIAGSIMAVLCALLFLCSGFILNTFFSPDGINSLLVLRILAFVPLLIVLDTVFATFTMLIFGKNRDYSKVVFYAGILNLLLAVILIPRYHHIGAACSLLLSELFVTILLFLFVKRNGLFPFKQNSIFFKTRLNT